MKTITIVSGKGGTGKTSIVAGLALSISKRHGIVVADCDVDAPNLGLVLGTKKKKRVERVSTSEKAVIDTQKCTRCGSCIRTCVFGAIDTGPDGYPVVNRYYCEGCGACTLVCPADAIRLEKRENGSISWGETEWGFPLVQGGLEIGESGSGMIVSLVKERAIEIARQMNASIVLVDGSPGIGCPVIASVSGSDYALIVTEPTAPAISDLERILGVLEHFGIPSGIIINRHDLDHESEALIEKLALERGIEIIARIPHDEAFIKAVNNLVPVTIEKPEYEKVFDEIARKIMEKTEKKTG